ncbi:MAG: tape measure protein [Tildeniella torsiva UHER 1998/13D]|nr:tape measure protein [Tildeniella torsiva UHER 1998/13D]
MTDAELQLKISLAKAGLERDAVAAAAVIRKQLGDVEADITLKADDKDVKLLERAISELADETLETARRAELLKKAYGLSDKEVEQVTRKMRQLGDETANAKKEGDGLQGAIAGLAAGAAFAAIDLLTNALQSAGQALFGFVQNTLAVGGAAQQSEVAFTTILGSAEDAQALLGELSDFAATTPFDLPGVRQAGQQLLAFGFQSDQITENLRRVGDVAAGVNTDFGELATIYGKARVAGRLYAEDVNQLTERGIPILQEFAAQFGVSEAEVKKLVEQGKIGFPELEQAFINLTKEGGKFGGLMEAQSKTIPGQISNISDGFTRLQESLFKAVEPALAGGLSTISAILAEAAEQSAGLDVLTDAATRLQAVLTDSPEVAEAFGGALAEIADAAIEQLAGVLDAITAFVSEEGNVEQVAQQLEVVADAITAIGTTVQFIIALADGIAQLQSKAEALPVIGDNLDRFLKFPTPFAAFTEILRALGEVFTILKDRVLEAVGGALDGLGRVLPAVQPVVEQVQKLLGFLQTDTTGFKGAFDGSVEGVDELNAAFGEYKKKAEEFLKPAAPTVDTEPAEAALTRLADANKAALDKIENDTTDAKTNLLNSGAGQDEITARERESLEQRVKQNEDFLAQLAVLQSQGLKPEEATKVAQAIADTEKALSGDRLRIAQTDTKAREDAAKAQEQSAKAETDRVKKLDADRKAAADAEVKRQADIAKAREEQIKAIEAEGKALVRNGQLAIEAAETQLQSLDRVADALTRQADLLKSQGDLLAAVGELQGAINDARADGLREIIGDEDASDSKKRKAAQELLALTEQRFAAEKAQLEQKQALELQAFDLGQQQAALAEQRAIREQELGLAKLELQRLEIENERTLAELRGDDSAVQIADRQLALLDQQAAAQADLIDSLQKEAALSQQIGAGQRQALVAQQEQQDIGLANQQQGQARSLDDEVSGISRSLDRRGDRLVDRADLQQQRELTQAQGALPALLAAARPNPQVQALAGLESISSPSQINLSQFVAPVVAEIQALGTAVNALAASPRQLTVQTPDPVADTSRILSDVARQSAQGVNP